MVFANVRKLVRIVLPFDHFHRQALLVRSVCMFCFNRERGIQSVCPCSRGPLTAFAPRNTDARDESKDGRRTQDTGLGEDAQSLAGFKSVFPLQLPLMPR